MENKFHYIARALIIQRESVLLVRSKGADNTFLPGGHIEFGEPAHSTLQREIFEEIGYELQVGSFIGALEHLWPQESKENHEINLVFSAALEGVSLDENPQSKEPHLEYCWVVRSEIYLHNLQPYPLNDLIDQWSYTKGYWGSTFM